MRVLLNDREIGGLDARLERCIAGRPSQAVVEGVAISTSDSIQARRRELRLLLFGAAGLVVILLGVNAIIVALRAPQAFADVAVACAGSAVFAGVVVAVLYAFMLGAHRRRVERRSSASLLPAGTAVRLDATGLTVDGRTLAWSALKVDELGVREQQGSESRVTYVERLVLCDPARAVPLDALFLSNGRTLLREAWRRVRAAGAAP